MLAALPTDGSYFRLVPKRSNKSFLLCHGSSIARYTDPVSKKAHAQAAETLREIGADIIAAERKKRRAVDHEDYDLAKTHKAQISELKNTKEALVKVPDDNALFQLIDVDGKYFRLAPKHLPKKFLAPSGRDDGEGDLLVLEEEKSESSLFEAADAQGGYFRLAPKTASGKYLVCLPGKNGLAVLKQDKSDASLFKITGVRHPQEFDTNAGVSEIFTMSRKFDPAETALDSTGWDLPVVTSPNQSPSATKMGQSGFAWTTSSRNEHTLPGALQTLIDEKDEELLSNRRQIEAYQNALAERMTVTCETKHNYHAKSSMLWPVKITDAAQIEIRFDPLSSVSADDGDAVIIFSDLPQSSSSNHPRSPTRKFENSSRGHLSRKFSGNQSDAQVLGHFTGRSEWPGLAGIPPLVIDADSFHVSFVAGPCKEQGGKKPWGFKLLATACAMKGIDVGRDGALSVVTDDLLPAPSQIDFYKSSVEDARKAREKARNEMMALQSEYCTTKAELNGFADNHKARLYAEAETQKAFAVAAYIAACAANAAFETTLIMQEDRAYIQAELKSLENSIVDELEANVAKSLKGPYKKRENMGSFTTGAQVALVSVPGGVARSANTRVAVFPTRRYEVSVGREEDEAKGYGHVVREKGHFDMRSLEGKQEWADGMAPMLLPGTSYTVKMDSGQEVAVDGKDMRYAGVAQYEFWERLFKLHAAADAPKRLIRKPHYGTEKRNPWKKATAAELRQFVEQTEGAGNWGKGEEDYDVSYDDGKTVKRVPRAELETHAQFSFACVWFTHWDPNHKGCCTMEPRLEQMAEEEAYERYESVTDGRAIKNADWVHSELSKAYKANKHGAVRAVEVVLGAFAGSHGLLKESLTPKERLKSNTAYQVRLHGSEEDTTLYGRDLELMPLPKCAHCAWFDPWQATVRRSSDDQQSLRFAYLQYPLSLDQPRFYCKATEKFYFVGPAQQVELCWAQDVMGLVVEPISVADTVYSMLGDKVKAQAQDLLKRLKAEPLKALNAREQPMFFGYKAPTELLSGGTSGALQEVQQIAMKAKEAWDGAKAGQEVIKLRKNVLSLRQLRAALQAQAYGEVREAEIRVGLENKVAQLEQAIADLKKTIDTLKAEQKKGKVEIKKMKKEKKDLTQALAQQEVDAEANLVAQEDAVNKKVRSEFKQKVSALQRRIEDLTPKKIDDRAVARAAGGARRRPSSAGADRPSGAASKAAQIAGGSMKQAEAKAKRQAPNQASSVPANSWQGGKHKAKYTPSAASQEAREKMIAQRERNKSSDREETPEEKEELLRQLKIETRQQRKILPIIHHKIEQLEKQIVVDATAAADKLRVQEEEALEVKWKLEEEVERFEEAADSAQSELTRVACQNAEGQNIYDTVKDMDGKGEFEVGDRIKIFIIKGYGTILRTENAMYDGTGVVEAYQFAYALDMSVATKVHIKWSGPRRFLETSDAPAPAPSAEAAQVGPPLSKSM
jgi:hypothetical protein